jgi:hypothetical protein
MTPKASTPNLPNAQQRVAKLRLAIEQAEAEGVSKDVMVLRLTLRDQSDLKRDPTIPLDEIRYADGEMTFLGVKVVSSGVTASVLDRGEA